MGNNNQSVLQLNPPGEICGITPMNDPMFGFEEGRAIRQNPKATAAEMEAAGLAPWQRDYCADQLIEVLICRRKNPRGKFLPCRRELGDFHHCHQNDFRLRLMEGERERRLLLRERRRNGQPEVDHPYLTYIPRKIHTWVRQSTGQQGW